MALSDPGSSPWGQGGKRLDRGWTQAATLDPQAARLEGSKEAVGDFENKSNQI